MEKYKTSEQNDRILVAMSPCLSSSHIVFQSPIQIQLPLINIPDTFEQDEICESLVFRWNTDGAFEVTDVVPEVVDGIGHFKVKSFSRYKVYRKSCYKGHSRGPEYVCSMSSFPLYTG